MNKNNSFLSWGFVLGFTSTTIGWTLHWTLPWWLTVTVVVIADLWLAIALVRHQRAYEASHSAMHPRAVADRPDRKRSSEQRAGQVRTLPRPAVQVSNTTPPLPSGYDISLRSARAVTDPGCQLH